jgi:membrane protein DedA with SNARE-associated domain
MSSILDFVIRHGEVIYVVADQIGIPVPAVPGLLAVGALAAADRINWVLALGSSVGASAGGTSPAPLSEAGALQPRPWAV